MRIQKATSADLKKVLDVYNNAREFMRTHNNGDQWGESYPPRELVEPIYAWKETSWPAFFIMQLRTRNVIATLRGNG